MGVGVDLSLVSSDVRRAAPAAADLAAGASAVHALGAGLYRQLGSVSGNLALSPYSVAVALGMTLNGAGGRTLAEMLHVLASPSAGELDRGLNAITQHVEGLAGPVRHPSSDAKDEVIALDAANAVFGQRGVTWERPFLDALARWYGAGMRQVDYVTSTEAARTAINGWTAQQTHDRIPEIVPPGVLDEMSRLVLVNTLYFKAPWATPFEKATHDAPFHLADKTSAAVPMMAATVAARPGAGDGWRSVRLPYADDTLAMTLVLPDAGRLAAVEAAIGTGNLSDLLRAGSSTQVAVTVPSWKFTSGAQLGDALKALGMPTAFSDRADFSAMTKDERLQISDVLHQVFIAVDEAGTEAAAATAVVMRDMSIAVPDQTLVFDRPFLFVIHDVEHGTPLFVGRVADPRA